MHLLFTPEDVTRRLDEWKQDSKEDPSRSKSITDLLGHDLNNALAGLGFLDLIQPTTPAQQEQLNDLHTTIPAYQTSIALMRTYITNNVIVDNERRRVIIPPLFVHEAAQPYLDNLHDLLSKKPFLNTMIRYGKPSPTTKEYHHYIDDALDMIMAVNNKFFTPQQDSYRIDIDTRHVIKHLKHRLDTKNIHVNEILEHQEFPHDYAREAIAYLLNNTIDHAFENTNNKRNVTIEGTSQNNSYIINVRDDGDGIDLKLFPDPNEVFGYRKSRRAHEHEEHGKGLYLVKGFLEEQGATITAQNNPEGGATFTLTLPKP